MSTDFDFKNIGFDQVTSGVIQVFNKTKKDKIIATIEKISHLDTNAMPVTFNGEKIFISKAQFDKALRAIMTHPQIDVDQCVSSVLKAMTDKTDLIQVGDIIHKIVEDRPKTASATAPAASVNLQRIEPAQAFTATAAQLLESIVMGRPISGTLLLTATQDLEKTYLEGKKHDLNYEILLHKLYDKAVEIFATEGNRIGMLEALDRAAQVLKFTPDHPLYNFDQAVSVQSKSQVDSTFGAHFSRLNTSGVKGQHIRVATRTLENDPHPTNVMQFKINPVLRNKLNTVIDALKNPALKDFLPPLLQKSGIIISEVPYVFKGKEENSNNYTDKAGYEPCDAMAIQIEFPGIGKIIIGKNEGSNVYATLANDVTGYQKAGLKPGEAIASLQQMFSIIGLGPILVPSRPEDIERVKIGRLFHTFFPKESIALQDTPQFYELPIEALKKKIVEIKPEMKAIFETHLSKMKEEEIYPGRKVWTVEISDGMRKKGAIGLMMGIAQDQEIENASKVACKLLTLGTISTFDRLQSGIMGVGSSFEDDLEAGGGDQVFTRLVTQNLIKEKIEGYPFHSKIQFLFDLDVLNRGCYGHVTDLHGQKRFTEKNFKGREHLREFVHLSPLDLIGKIDARKSTDNEFMIKNRISPEFVRGLVVGSEKDKEVLIKTLREKGFRLEKKDGVDVAIGPNGIRVGIYVSDPKTAKFNDKMWKTV